MWLMIFARECDRNGIIASGAADDAIRLFVENQEKMVMEACLTLLLAFARICTIMYLDMCITISLFRIFWKIFVMVRCSIVRLLDCCYYVLLKILMWAYNLLKGSKDMLSSC